MRYVVLLRGINVGGHKKLPMAELRALASGLGYDDVSTYIQSGNLFLTTDDAPEHVACAIHDQIQDEFGYDISVIIRAGAEVESAMATSPFAAAAGDATHLHIGFLASAPEQALVAALAPKTAPGEEFRVIGRELHLYLPGGMGRSKLMTFNFAKALGVDVTVRNWRTVNTLLVTLTTGDSAQNSS